MKKPVTKKLLTIVMSLALVFTFAGCGSSSGSSKDAGSNPEPSSSEKSSAKTFTVGFDQDFPPYGFVDDETGDFTGFDLELAGEVAKRLGMEIKYQPIAWDSKDMELDSGTIDCIWNGFTINGREEDYEWSDAYMNNSQVFVVRSADKISKQEDLKDKIVTVQTDSSAQAALDSKEHKALKDSFKEVVVCDNYNSAFMDLESEAVDAIAMDVGVARYQIKQKSNSDDFTILDGDIAKEQYGIGFKKGNTSLRDQVNDTLKEMAKDGKFAEISKKWFDEDVCIIKP